MNIATPSIVADANSDAASAKVDAIRRKVIDVAALPLTRAATLPREAYTEEDYFAFERRTVLEAGWMCVAHVSELKDPGSFVALDLLGEPLIIVRTREGDIRVLSRVCAHRAMDIMPDCTGEPHAGSTTVLTCPYHRWVYNLDGSLRGCPHMERAADFNKPDWRLAAFRSEIWNGFVFVNIDGKAPPLAAQYADFAALVAPWRADEMEIVIRLTWDCAFNWKVMIENWMESYHHVGAHLATLEPTMPGRNTWTDAEHPHFIRAHLPFTEALQHDLKAAIDSGRRLPGFRPLDALSFEQQSEWGLYLGYPCFMFLTMRDRLLWYRLLPISAERCRLETMMLVPRASLADPDIATTIEAETRMLRDFHTEDMVVNTAVQRGLRSSRAVRGRLSHLEEPIWLIQRYLAARAQGSYPARAERAPYSGPFARA